MMEAPAKPRCGGGGLDADAYDLPLHVVALFLVLGASLLGCGFPVLAKKVKWLKIPTGAFFITKHFGTGVLIATAFVHLLPTAFASLTDPCLPDLFTTQYPALSGVIMMTSMLLLFCIELWLHGKTGGHSHGGATGENLLNHAAPPGRSVPIFVPRRSFDSTQTGSSTHTWPSDDKHSADIHIISSTHQPYRPPPYHMPLTNSHHKISAPLQNTAEIHNHTNDHLIPKSDMPPWFIAFYAQYTRQRDELRAAIEHVAPHAFVSPSVPSHLTDLEDTPIDPAVFRKMSLNITLLEGGILFHSVFVGMTVSIETEGFAILLVAILFHQMFEGLGLGSRIAAVPYPKGSIRPWVLVGAFGLTCPIGQAIGLVTRSSYDPNSAFALVLVGTFNAISSGLLIYAALVDLLAEDFLSEEASHTMSGKKKIHGIFWVFMGAIGMAIVGAFA
ncbi:Fe transporter [Geopyxis carbonaria]|nr:Fe transporter [Geopyxis carbonaria]